MKLFFDENLSPKLAEILKNEYPDSSHVRDVGLRGTADSQIWNYCKDKGYIIVSKDTDFRERSFVKGYPPKVIWLDVGNAGTEAIVKLLQNEQKRIKQFAEKEETSLLILSIGENAV